MNVDEEHFAKALELFRERGAKRGLSFADCASLVLTKVRAIGLIASFDRGFDGFVPRLS